MRQRFLWAYWVLPFALAAILMSCVHTPDPHVHGSVPTIPQDTPIVIEGNVIDSETGAPIPHAVLYLVDTQPENRERLSKYSARLGTANHEGHVDLAAKWTTTFDPSGELEFMPGYDRLGDTEGLIAWAEVRCREGELGNIVFAVVGERHEWHYNTIDSTALKPQADGTLIVTLGQIVLQPRPPSDFLSYESFEAAIEREEAESTEEDMP